MQENVYLMGLLARFPNVKEDQLQFLQITVPGLSFLTLCRLLSENGRVLETDETAHTVIVAIASPPSSLNEGVAAVLLKDDTLYIAAYANEGLFKQHTAEKILQRFTELVK